MKIIFESMDKNKNITAKSKVVEYDIKNETPLDIKVEANKDIFPIVTINDGTNLDGIGYIDNKNILFIQYKEMKKSIEGIELGMRPEPIGYFYHNVDKSVYNTLLESKNKVKFIKDYIQKNYMFHREPIGLDLFKFNN